MSKIVEIKNNRPRIYSANGVTLQPGLNKVPAEDAEKFLKHPHILIKQDRGFIEVRGSKAVNNEDATGDEELASKSAKELVDMIKQSEDKGLLENLAKDERSTVYKAAQVRLDELKGE